MYGYGGGGYPDPYGFNPNQPPYPPPGHPPPHNPYGGAPSMQQQQMYGGGRHYEQSRSAGFPGQSTRSAGFPGQGNTYGGHSAGPPPGPPPQDPYGFRPPSGPPPQQQFHNSPPPQQSRYGGGGGGMGGSFAKPSFEMQSDGMGHNFQMSNCSGRKKALIVGINYYKTNNELRGCVNDARAVSAFLQDRYGYKQDDMVILTDDQRDPRSHPTKNNILRGMQWLVKDARPNDTLFFHYSGHGGQTEDLDGDEDDGYDETIYPVDFQQAGHIVDDQMHDFMVKPLPPGARLTALFDSCHSGTALDLPFVYGTDGKLKEMNIAKEGAQGLMGAVSAYTQGDIGTAFKSVGGFLKKATTGRQAEQKSRQLKFSPADVVQISGCKDSQTSADSQNAGVNTGAMSYAFISVMTQSPNQSYISLLNDMRSTMAQRYKQLPQLSCSHPLDMNLQFIM